MPATGASNTMEDLPLDGGSRSVLEVVKVYGEVTTKVGVDTTDTGVELICLGVKCASEVDEKVCASGVADVSTFEGVASLTDIMCVLAVPVVSEYGV